MVALSTTVVPVWADWDEGSGNASQAAPSADPDLAPATPVELPADLQVEQPPKSDGSLTTSEQSEKHDLNADRAKQQFEGLQSAIIKRLAEQDPNSPWAQEYRESQRGPAPEYQSGFGNIAKPKEQQLAPLNPSMLQLPQQRQPGSTMFHRSGSEGFFGGLKNLDGVTMPSHQELYGQQPAKPPAWAQDKLQNKHFYVEGTEHHGNEDPHGFF